MGGHLDDSVAAWSALPAPWRFSRRVRGKGYSISRIPRRPCCVNVAAASSPIKSRATTLHTDGGAGLNGGEPRPWGRYLSMMRTSRITECPVSRRPACLALAPLRSWMKAVAPGVKVSLWTYRRDSPCFAHHVSSIGASIPHNAATLPEAHMGCAPRQPAASRELYAPARQ